MQGFDLYGRLNQVTVDGINNVFTYGYLEGTHLQKTLAMPNGVTRTFGYEANRDLLTMIVHSNATDRLVQRDFTFDGLARLGNRTLFRANETPVNPDAFGYNIRSELTNAVINANAFAYNFDPIGNRLAATEFGTNTSYIASALNQYTSINPVAPADNAFTPAFDLDGNQTLLKTTTGIWYVWYNAENRPVCFSNDTIVVSMAYDYKGRRFEYKETVNNTLTRHERYLYRGYLQIAALDMLNSASVKHTITWDPTEPTATRPLALQIGANAYFYSSDQVKNVSELFDSAGTIAAKYDYSPFGQISSFQITQSGNNALTQFSNPLTFSSEINDSTLGLQYYNYRHLNLLDGRWVNRDPIGERGGMNVYAIVENNITLFDSLGSIVIGKITFHGEATEKKWAELKRPESSIGHTSGNFSSQYYCKPSNGIINGSSCAIFVGEHVKLIGDSYIKPKKMGTNMRAPVNRRIEDHERGHNLIFEINAKRLDDGIEPLVDNRIICMKCCQRKVMYVKALEEFIQNEVKYSNAELDVTDYPNGEERDKKIKELNSANTLKGFYWKEMKEAKEAMVQDCDK